MRASFHPPCLRHSETGPSRSAPERHRRQSYRSVIRKYIPTFSSAPLAAPCFGYGLFLFLPYRYHNVAFIWHFCLQALNLAVQQGAGGRGQTGRHVAAARPRVSPPPATRPWSACRPESMDSRCPLVPQECQQSSV